MEHHNRPDPSASFLPELWLATGLGTACAVTEFLGVRFDADALFFDFEVLVFAATAFFFFAGAFWATAFVDVREVCTEAFLFFRFDDAPDAIFFEDFFELCFERPSLLLDDATYFEGKFCNALATVVFFSTA